MGVGAEATNNETFVWSDGTAIGSTTNQQFSAYASNGYRLLGGPIEGNGGNLTGTGTTFTAGAALTAPPDASKANSNSVVTVVQTNSTGTAVTNQFTIGNANPTITLPTISAAGGATTELLPWSNQNTFDLIDEFPQLDYGNLTIGVLGWQVGTVIGGASGYSLRSGYTAPNGGLGVLRMISGTASNDGPAVLLTSGVQAYSLTNITALLNRIVVQLGRTNNVMFRGVLSDGFVGVELGANVVGFRYDTRLGDTKWMGYVRTNSINVTVDTGVAPDSTRFQSLQWWYTNPGTVWFSVGTSTPVSVTATIPNASYMPIIEQISESTSTYTNYIDSWRLTGVTTNRY
jgi:hypothetical protein